MSNSQTIFDAHMALVIDYGIKAAEYARASTGTFKLMCGKDAAYAAIEASARALAAIPAEPDALGYATRLAQAIFDKHFAHEPHFSSGDVVWRPLDDLLGVLTQIDNMVAGIAQQAGGVPAGRAAWENSEGWESLAWELCADENGEEACNELIWEGGPIPEPWGEHWLKYEDEAKRLIKLVHKHAAAPSPSAVQPLSEAHGDVRVACITLDGSTLYIPAKEITDFGIGDDDGETYTLTFKTMTRAEFEALGEFDGF